MADKGTINYWHITYPGVPPVLTTVQTYGNPYPLDRGTILVVPGMLPEAEAGATVPTTGQLWPRGNRE